MKIDKYIDEFLKTQFKYDRDGLKTAKTLFKSDKEYALVKTDGFGDSESLEEDMRNSVKGVVRGKDSAIRVYRKFVQFLQSKGVDVEVTFPPIPIESSFERQMFIAKYLQPEDARVENLPKVLWVSDRTIDTDLQRLYRESEDPIQICGRRFYIPETKRSMGQIYHASTVHPLFLTENLTQVIIMLKGLRSMAENPMYRQYAEATAADIWEQLSDYAKNRIHFVLSKLLPEDLSWYEELEKKTCDRFVTERQCSVRGDVWLDCIKNDKTFFVEYKEDDGAVIYKDCSYIQGTYHLEDGFCSIEVMCDQGQKRLTEDRVIRSCYTIEELISD